MLLRKVVQQGGKLLFILVGAQMAGDRTALPIRMRERELGGTGKKPPSGTNDSIKLQASTEVWQGTTVRHEEIARRIEGEVRLMTLIQMINRIISGYAWRWPFKILIKLTKKNCTKDRPTVEK